jgi:hypothetical protein
MGPRGDNRAVLGRSLGLGVEELLGIGIQLRLSGVDARAHPFCLRFVVCWGGASHVVAFAALTRPSGGEFLLTGWFVGYDNPCVGSLPGDSRQTADVAGSGGGSRGRDRGVRVHLLLVRHSEHGDDSPAWLAVARGAVSGQPTVLRQTRFDGLCLGVL